MRPFVRVKLLTSEDYKQLRKLAKLGAPGAAPVARALDDGSGSGP
jgi:hypothetical protein